MWDLLGQGESLVSAEYHHYRVKGLAGCLGALAFFLTLWPCQGELAHGQLAAGMNPYYVKVPGVTGVYTSTPASSFSASYDSAGARIPFQLGHEVYMLLSLSGLAAKAVLNGTNDELIYVDVQNYPYAYGQARSDLFSRKGLANLGTKSPWELVDMFVDKGIVKGYVVYHYETGSRGLFSGGSFDGSANVATVYAHQLDAIMIEESLIATAQAHGLSQLADCRSMTQEAAWNTWRESINRDAVAVVDPKNPWNRDYAVATGCFAIHPLDPAQPSRVTSFYRNTLLPAMNGHFPVLGWAGGDEFNHTEAATVNSGFNTATSYDCNLILHSLLLPGEDDAPGDYHINRKSTVDLTGLKWERDVHYTAMIMSDGDFFGLNNTYIDDEISGRGEYFGNPDRGLFPMNWGCAAADLFQAMPSSVRMLGELASPNDQFVQMGGGYFYPDLYPDLAGHMAQMKPLLEKMNLHVWMGIFNDIDSPAGRHAQQIIGGGLNRLAGLFPIQYYPYNGAYGQITWVNDSAGYEIPVMPAKYAVWSNSDRAFEGTPIEVSGMINNAMHEGVLDNQGFFDWAIIHVWSFFRNGEDMDQATASFSRLQGVERAYASAKWVHENLDPHVRLVTAEELAWQVALHMRSNDALCRMLDVAATDLAAMDYSLAQRDMLERQVAYLRGIIADNKPVNDNNILTIDTGTGQYAAYGPPTSSQFIVTPGSVEQSVDGSASTRFQLGAGHAFTNMEFAPVDAYSLGRRLVFDLHGDGGGSVIRLELFSRHAGGFVYYDVALDFQGWRHYELLLDGSDGLLVHDGTHQGVLSQADIWQISGPWNGKPATFYLDNAMILGAGETSSVDFTNESTKREYFLKVQDLLRTIRAGVPLESFADTFETFQEGALPQGGWIDALGAAAITASKAFGGSQCLELGGGARVTKLVYDQAGERVSVKAMIFIEEEAGVGQALVLKPGLAEMRFDGDNVEVTTGDPASPERSFQGVSGTGRWLDMGIDLNFQRKTWDLYIDGEAAARDLAFVESTAAALMEIEWTGRQFVDDVEINPSGSAGVEKWIRLK